MDIQNYEAPEFAFINENGNASQKIRQSIRQPYINALTNQAASKPIVVTLDGEFAILDGVDKRSGEQIWTYIAIRTTTAPPRIKSAYTPKLVLPEI